VHPRTTLALLTALNFINYIDRYVLPAVQQQIQREFHTSDFDLGFLTTAFFLCYMFTAPVVGLLADRYSRKLMIVAGALIWSGATLLTAVTYDFRTLLIRHTIVGLGEATFVAIAPAYISDLFAENRRGRVLAIFSMAIPAGTALGYMVGGLLGAYGWRIPFLVAAGPGVILALAMAAFPEPARGAQDTLRDTAERGTLRGLTRNAAYWTSTLGMAMMTFALGGLSVWMPTFLSRVRGVPESKAGIVFGIITLVNGIVATLLGGWAGDRMLARRKDAYYIISGVSLACGVPLMLAAIFLTGSAMFSAIWAACFVLLFNTGPLNAAVVDSVGPRIRASAVALNLFVIHLLGDAPSAPLIGYISDRTHSLQIAFLLAVLAVALSSGILFYGARFAPGREPARKEATV
jgi:MFS transporter, Spinster family, sphingosine-1-phosphate transporter